MSVAQIIAARDITEAVHFTTNHGCLGTLYTRNLLSRSRLQDDEMVRYLFAANAELRRDIEYLDYVSLSVQHINTEFFRISSGKWHREEPIFWCVLAFDPVVLTHEGVVFATTNNIYSSVLRATGQAGLERLFSGSVNRWPNNIAFRVPDMRLSYPTCSQAEALYPAMISTEHLRRVYVHNLADQSEVAGFLKATFHREVDVVVEPSKFGSRPI